MRSSFRRSFLLAALGGLALFASCEEHPASEWPEVQKEHVYPESANERAPAGSAGQSPAAKPTPADFFPDTGR
jgi:hypothetical protein